MLLQAFGPLIVKESSAPGLTFAFHRLWMATLIVALMLVLLRRNRPTLRTLRLAAPGGMLFAINLGFFFSAVKNTSTANATVLASTHPLLLMFITHRMFGERSDRTDLALAAAALAGVALVVFGASASAGGGLKGDLLALCAMVMFAGYLAASKKAREEMDAITYQCNYLAVAVVCTAPMVLISGQGFAVEEASDWRQFLLMAILPGTGHILLNAAHPHVRLVMVSLALLCIPAISAVLAWLILDENMTVVQILGTALVLGAMALVVLRSLPSPAIRR